MKSLRFASTALAVTLAQVLFVPATAARTEFTNAAQPQLAATTDGRVWLVYVQTVEASVVAQGSGHDHHQAAAPEGNKGKKGGHGPQGRSGDLFVACSIDGGATFSAPVKVAHVPQLMVGNRRGPRIAAQGDRITVTAIAHELIAFTSNDGGKTWGQPVTINDVPNSAREGLHDLAGSSGGELFVTWLDLRNEKTELWAAGSKDGGRTWTKNDPIYKSPDKSICECCHPSALFDAEDNLAVMWRNSIAGSRDMWLMTRARGSARFTPARKLGEGTWKINGCPHDGGTLVGLGDGKFGAVWQRSGEVFLTRDQDAEFKLGKGRQPAVTNGAAPLVIWNDGTDLVVMRDLRGAQPTQRVGDARFPCVVALPDGRGAVVAYERGPRGSTSIAVERL